MSSSSSPLIPCLSQSSVWSSCLGCNTTNPLNTPCEIAKQIPNSRASLAFSVPELVPKLVDLNPILLVVLIDGENQYYVARSGAKQPLIVSRLSEMLTKKANRSGERVRKQVYLEDMATLLYPLGTTGESKGVVSFHRNLILLDCNNRSTPPSEQTISSFEIL
ncbi:Probable CoA ligase CCL5 [Linum perenne]